jgi:hypothetical protein
MARTVGKLFRPVVIEPELRELVDAVLIAVSPEEPSAVAAMRRIREKATASKAYLYAVEIRSYLEEKIRVGSEPVLFTLAGDLFLDALEYSRSPMGPNFLRDHYSGMLGCYRDGVERAKAIEGPMYCLELVLLKAMDLALDGDPGAAHASTPLPAFVPAEATDRGARVRECLRLAENLLDDAVQQAVRAGKGEVPDGLIDFVATHRERMGGIVKRWERLLGDDVRAEPVDEFLSRALDVVRELGHIPLAAGIEERLGLLIDPKRKGTKESARYFFEAADLFVGQGNLDREAGAYNMALRRYARALGLFGCFSDRTAMAKVLVEQARLYIRKGGDGEHIQYCLNRAVSLVLAHRQGLPAGQLPTLDHQTVYSFLESKGYIAEAQAYEAAVSRAPM